MKIPQALVELLSSIELSSENVIDERFAVKLQDMVTGILEGISQEELKGLTETLQLLKDSEDEASSQRIEFLDTFLESYGIEE